MKLERPFRVQMSPKQNLIFNHLNQIEYKFSSSSLNSTLIIPSHLCLGLPSIVFRLPGKNVARISYPSIRVTCPAQIILLYFITQIIFGQDCKLRHSTPHKFSRRLFLSRLFKYSQQSYKTVSFYDINSLSI